MFESHYDNMASLLQHALPYVQKPQDLMVQLQLWTTLCACIKQTRDIGYFSKYHMIEQLEQDFNFASRKNVSDDQLFTVENLNLRDSLIDILKDKRFYPEKLTILF